MGASNPLPLSKPVLHNYLTSVYHVPVEVLQMWKLGENPEDTCDLKGFGYGVPYVIEFKVNGETKRVILETMCPKRSF